MRLIGKLPEQSRAERFADYLLTRGVTAMVEDEDGLWLIWVVEEDRLDYARDELEAFKDSPGDERFLNVQAEAKKIRDAERSRAVQAERNFQDVRNQWQPTIGAAAKRTPITVALIAICIIVAIWTRLGNNGAAADHFFWVSYRHTQENEWRPTNIDDVMVDIYDGQVWRIFAPMILHLGPLHLLFNMMWLYMLGGQIERAKGKVKFVAFVLLLAAISGFAQAVVVQQPFFGGMSGVVYGLLGYVWMKMKFDPRDHFYISQSNILFMMAWFIICFMPGTGVANGGHAGGLVAGLLIGYGTSQMRK